jgi:hypothetical protein
MDKSRRGSENSGFTRLTIRIYSGARRDEVTGELIGWLDEVVG